MDREILKQLLFEQSGLKQKEQYIPREILKKIREFVKTPFVIIISGVRRAGKSTLLKEIMAEQDGYYVNFDDDRLVNFSVSDFQQMYELLIELFGNKEIFFFDEIQNIKSWERFVRRLHDHGKKIYVTGSNASMLSKELGTHLTGRNIAFSLFPFSFNEFLQLKKQSVRFDMSEIAIRKLPASARGKKAISECQKPKVSDHAQKCKAFLTHAQEHAPCFSTGVLDTLTTEQRGILKRFFNEYMEKGGFPEYLQTEKEEYVKSVYENILYRDIITRYSLPDERSLKELVYYAASNIGKEISFNSIRKLVNLTSATTVREYFEYLENSYLAFLLPRYNPSLKKQIYFNKKVYFVDTALARLLGFRPTEDKGRMLENIVFLHLKRQSKEIYFHKENHECDFVVRKGTHIIEAIQVTKNLGKNNEREINGLLEAMDTYKLTEGLILTLDEEDTLTFGKKKVFIKPIWKWLLE